MSKKRFSDEFKEKAVLMLIKGSKELSEISKSLEYRYGLHSSGNLDGTFNSSWGANYYVHVMALQSDGKILIVGSFTTYGGTTRQRIAHIWY